MKHLFFLLTALVGSCMLFAQHGAVKTSDMRKTLGLDTLKSISPTDLSEPRLSGNTLYVYEGKFYVASNLKELRKEITLDGPLTTVAITNPDYVEEFMSKLPPEYEKVDGVIYLFVFATRKE